MSFMEVARGILREENRPLSATEITRIALKKGLLATTGQTPQKTMYATLLKNSRRGGPNAPIKLSRGLFQLPPKKAATR